MSYKNFKLFNVSDKFLQQISYAIKNKNIYMKKYLVIIAAMAIIAACNSNSSGKTSADTSAAATTAPANDLSSNPDYQKGLSLIAANDCLTCHKVDEKVTGPAYREVANKYENTDANVKMLAEKVIKGGSGNWGNVAMTPHPALSEDDAETMVKYVLLLRNK
jgi:cytochrome c